MTGGCDILSPEVDPSQKKPELPLFGVSLVARSDFGGISKSRQASQVGALHTACIQPAAGSFAHTTNNVSTRVESFACRVEGRTM
jgi:hypothetical protein